MGKFEVDKVVINLRLLKLCGFYQMFDPNTTKFLNRNVYQFLGIVFTAFIMCVISFGYVGMFTNKDETESDIDFLLLIISHVSCYISVVKMSVFLYNANKVWDLFDITQLEFLKSKMCRKNINTMYGCRDWIIKITNYSSLVSLVLCIQWTIFPLILNAINDTNNRYYYNVSNLNFPVSNHIYNQYYIIFYIIGIMYISYCAYSLITFNVFFISFCWVIMSLYQTITMSFAEIGYTNNSQSEHYEDFKSIVTDQIQFHLKIKSFYCFIRPYMIIYVSLSSCLIITMTCAFIKIYSEHGSYSVVDAFKLGSTVAYVYFELFLFCSLLDNINTARDSVNFGIYSCNWTMMDLKFKKLLLLTMRMNDANKLLLKASPSKIMNLQLFANVMKMCYNCTSILLKTIKNE